MGSLDIPEPQVAVYYGDGGHGYHWRMLLVRLDGSSWVCATATFSVQQIDLADYTVVPLTRNAPFPAGVLGDIFALWRHSVTAIERFGERIDWDTTMNPARTAIRGSTFPGPADEQTLERVRTRGQAWASVLDDQADSPSSAVVCGVLIRLSSVMARDLDEGRAEKQGGGGGGNGMPKDRDKPHEKAPP